ncbi:hypothetical protein BJ165DRAFT_1500118, partial [Panaeolus papilionaceus]
LVHFTCQPTMMPGDCHRLSQLIENHRRCLICGCQSNSGCRPGSDLRRLYTLPFSYMLCI